VVRGLDHKHVGVACMLRIHEHAIDYARDMRLPVDVIRRVSDNGVGGVVKSSEHLVSSQEDDAPSVFDPSD